MERKVLRVVAAVITDATKSHIFATARGYGEQKGQWEFPGGKIEPGETPQQALIREIREELAVEIAVGQQITRLEYDYPSFHLSMDCFWATLVNDEPILKEAQECAWLTRLTLNTVPWLPADQALLPLLAEQMA